MARPKEFDRDQALDRAMALFWRSGYEATSMTDLVDHVGVGRQSLYDTFGDKRALYLAALDRYLAGPAGNLELATDRPLRAQLRATFEGAIARALGDPEHGCCMMLLAAAERAPADCEVAARFGQALAALERPLVKRLRVAQKAGELGPHHDPIALARYLISALYGLQLTARGVSDRGHLQQIADVTLSVLG